MIYDSEMMIPCQKSNFDIPESVAYLNNAYMSPLSRPVSAAMRQGLTYKERPWTYVPGDIFSFVEEARGLAGKVYGADPNNIAVIPSVSYGMQIAANNLPLEQGEKILVLEDQFPSNIYPWQDKAERVGGHVVILPTPADDDWTRLVLSAIDREVAIVALPQTHWASGATLDLLAIRKALDEVGAALVLDLTQSLGAQPFDADMIKPDFAVCATYKWLMGPYSTGFVYIDPKWHNTAPLEHNWINRNGSEDFSRLTQYQTEFQPGARRFDMGEKSNAGQMLGASAALKQILDWGVESIARTLAAKNDYIAQELVPLGFEAVADALRASHYLGVRRPEGLDEGLLESLKENQIYVSIRGTAMRITPHVYVSDSDIERFLDAIKRFYT